MSRKLVLGLSVLVTILGIAVVADALVVTDAERLDGFVSEVTERDPGRRINGALHYADPARVEVEVSAFGDRFDYGEGEEVELSERLHDVLSEIEYGDIDVVQRTVRVTGDDGLAALRIETEEGIVDTEFRFSKHGDGWLLRRVRVR